MNTRAEKQRALDLAKEKIKRHSENKIDTYYPDEGPLRRELYPRHMEFFAAGLTYRERCAMCANRVGKCCTSETIIDTPRGPRAIGELYAAGRPFDVCAAPGVVARAHAPFKKSRKEPCLRIETADGQWFECALGHRILTDDGWFFAGDYVQLSRLQGGYAPDPMLSSLGYGPTVRGVDAPRSSQTIRDYQDHCFGGPRRCGEQLPDASDSVLVPPPLRGGAPEHILASSQGGASGSRYTNNYRRVYDPPSIQDAIRRHADLFAEWLSLAGDTTFQSLFAPHLVGPLSPVGGVAPLPPIPLIRLRRKEGAGCCGLNCGTSSTQPHGLWSRLGQQRPHGGSAFGQKLKIELGHNPLKLSSEVEAVYFIGAHDVYDFTVEEHHTYMAGGVIHHNTEGMGGYETALHLTGDYPNWWPGRRFAEPVDWWACGKTNETARDIVQTKLMGPMGAIGTGLIRAKNIINWTRKAGVHDLMDTVQVQHASGGISVLGLKSYQQGRDSFEGTEKDGIWDDEEPPEDIYGEQLIRTATTNGMMLLTFTPLAGMSRVVMNFMPQETRLEV